MGIIIKLLLDHYSAGAFNTTNEVITRIYYLALVKVIQTLALRSYEEMETLESFTKISHFSGSMNRQRARAGNLFPVSLSREESD